MFNSDAVKLDELVMCLIQAQNKRIEEKEAKKKNKAPIKLEA